MTEIKSEEDIDHELTDEIVCPWCGEIEGDSFEAPNDGEYKCHECNKKYSYSRNVRVTYDTERIKDDD
jgi:formylmethanofuran dehydrogenase subunit E